MTRVSDVMTDEVVTIGAEASVRELAQLLSRSRVSGAPVMGPDGRPVGVVSQSDLATYAAHCWARPPQTGRSPSGSFYDGLWLGQVAPEALESLATETRVGDIMAPFVYYASEDTSVLELSGLMLEKHIHRVVVMRGDEVVGMVSSLDLIRGLREQLLTVLTAQ
ncbi:CBS domain-containing protein [bacterium CPR1]|nr:CBS domain-containing protein [bacterium CPR1]